MAARFVDVSESEIDQFKENAVPQKMLQNLESSYSKGRLIKFLFCKQHNLLKTGMNVYIFLLQSVGNVCEIFCSAEWFQQQQEFTNEI